MAPFPDFDTHCLVRWLRGMLAGLMVSLALVASSAEPETPLVVGDRTIHVFRVALGAQSATERADAARRRITQALNLGDPEHAKLVPKAQWRPAPAAPAEAGKP